MSSIKAIKVWYRGKPAKNRYPEVISAGYEPHWMARAIKATLSYIKKEYKWLIGIALILLGLMIGSGN